jgi:hypothetical protein
VLVRDPLVAEVLAELVHPLQTPDDQSLQVELRRDPQVEVAVERIVVGREGTRQRPAVEGLEDRRLDLEEAALVEPRADGLDHPGAKLEQLPRLRVRHQVELSAPVAGLDILEAVVLVGRRAHRLGEQGPALYPQRELALLGLERHALDADDVPEVEPHELIVLGVSQHVGAGVELDLSGAVAEVEEGRLAMTAPRGQPPGHPVADVGLLTRLEAFVAGAHLGDLGALAERVRERVAPALPQALQLRAPLPDQL